MTVEAKSAKLDGFHELRTVGELDQFLSALDAADPFENALLRFAAGWPARQIGDPQEPFDPGHHLAADFSAALYGKWPCVFLGTNEWALKPALDTGEAISKMDVFVRNIRTQRSLFPDKEIVLAVIPEKDYLVNQLFIQDGQYHVIDKAFEHLKNGLRDLDVKLVFDQAIQGMQDYQSESDFLYPDTHLTTRNYLMFLANTLDVLGLEWKAYESNIKFAPAQEYFDLADKLDHPGPNPHRINVASLPLSEIRRIDGFANFQDPLGDTWQHHANDNPLWDKRVLLLGDSHSSIFDRHKLNYLIANAFRETIFYWNPCGIRGPVPDHDPDVVILEISQRFMF